MWWHLVHRQTVCHPHQREHCHILRSTALATRSHQKCSCMYAWHCCNVECSSNEHTPTQACSARVPGAAAGRTLLLVPHDPLHRPSHDPGHTARFSHGWTGMHWRFTQLCSMRVYGRRKGCAGGYERPDLPKSGIWVCQQLPSQLLKPARFSFLDPPATNIRELSGAIEGRCGACSTLWQIVIKKRCLTRDGGQGWVSRRHAPLLYLGPGAAHTHVALHLTQVDMWVHRLRVLTFSQSPSQHPLHASLLTPALCAS